MESSVAINMSCHSLMTTLLFLLCHVVLVPAADDAASSCSSGHSADKVRWETVYTGPLTTADVRHLKPACRYMLRVRAHNSIGGSNWGEALTATTSAAAPSQPASLTTTAVSSSAILLRWTAPLEDNGAHVTSYQLEMAAAGSSSSSSWSKVYQGSSLEYQHCSGMLPGRSYSWRLRAFNSCGAGAWSEPVKGSALPAEPGAPAKPSFSQRTATSVKVKWGLPQEENGSAVTTYVLELRQVAAGADVQQQAEVTQPPQQQWQQAYRGPELSQKVTGLQPGSNYEVRVAAENAVGLGPWSEVSSVEVLKRPPPPPASITAELEGGADAVAAGSVPACLLVSWPAAEAAADSADAVGYEVEAAPAHGSSHAVLRSNVAKQTSTSISSGLQLGVTYNVRVRSVGAAGTGHSSWSAAVAVVMPAAPAAPASEGDASESALALTPASAADAGAGGCCHYLHNRLQLFILNYSWSCEQTLFVLLFCLFSPYHQQLCAHDRKQLVHFTYRLAANAVYLAPCVLVLDPSPSWPCPNPTLLTVTLTTCFAATPCTCRQAQVQKQGQGLSQGCCSS
jgi:predicted phage tail protein